MEVGCSRARLVRRVRQELRPSKGFPTGKALFTRLANAGVPSELRMKLTGHLSEAAHRGYTHHELQMLRKAVAKLLSLGS